MIIRRLIASMAVAFVILHAEQVGAQDASPAPPANVWPSPPVNRTPAVPGPFPSGGAAPLIGGGFGAPALGYSEACLKDFVPLREEAEKRAKLIKAAADRSARPDEACKLIAGFGQAQVKMIKFVEANTQTCGIPAQIGDQLRAGHKNTEALQQKVCGVAQQIERQSPHGPAVINDIGDPVMEKLFAPR